MASWPIWGLPERHRWLPGHNGDYQSDPDGYMAKIGTTRVAQMATRPRVVEWLPGHDGNYQSGPDGYMAKMGTTRVALMATWPR